MSFLLKRSSALNDWWHVRVRTKTGRQPMGTEIYQGGLSVWGNHAGIFGAAIRLERLNRREAGLMSDEAARREYRGWAVCQA